MSACVCVCVCACMCVCERRRKENGMECYMPKYIYKTAFFSTNLRRRWITSIPFPLTSSRGIHQTKTRKILYSKESNLIKLFGKQEYINKFFGRRMNEELLVLFENNDRPIDRLTDQTTDQQIDRGAK